MEMKIEETVTVKMTGNEMRAIRKFLGATSIKSRMDVGLSPEQAELLTDIYSFISKEEERIYGKIS